MSNFNAPKPHALSKRKKGSRGMKGPEHFDSHQLPQSMHDNQYDMNMMSHFYDRSCSPSVMHHHLPVQQPLQPFPQRLYPAISDPTVCHNYPGLPSYSMPYMHAAAQNYDMSAAPVSLPYYPVKNYPNNSVCGSRHSLPRKYHAPSNATSDVTSNSKTDINHEQFTSLPPVVSDLIADENEKRRFSDPGIGPLSDDNSDNSSGRSSAYTIDSKKNKLLYSLMDQINHLKENYARLYKELQETKLELSQLKQNTTKGSYEPGNLSEIIKELRDAVKAREDAIITRVRHMIEEKSFNNTYSPSTVFTTNKEIDVLKVSYNEKMSSR